MKSLIPVLLTISITLTLKGYFSTNPFNANVTENISTPAENSLGEHSEAHKILVQFPQTFELQLVKTAIIPFEKSLDFANPHLLSDYPLGDVNWISREGLNTTFPPAKVQFFPSRNPFFHGLSRSQLNQSSTVNYLLPNHLLGHPCSAQNLPSNTVITYQTADGSYYILGVKQISWGKSRAIELSVYHAS
ncbi:hypothetical protein [Dyadobacter pollutisoli]|jgi:hypothetical protein|uniref:Uncharacterized protein n=1 Tax=Dyadobacter pollutisoli TaxID=2910158 RepID=A0A9E8NDY3_9BACT|nr:hypothetical protein [Dyadobacter pollutisoli]WAC14213.1 hypothetical protein ON006_09685 [Dyadobacter pollutisoli]